MIHATKKTVFFKGVDLVSLEIKERFRRTVDPLFKLRLRSKAISIFSDTARIVHRCHKRDDLPKAEPIYRQAISIDPRNPVGYHNLAGTLRDTGRIEEAELMFKKSMRKSESPSTAEPEISSSAHPAAR